ncbi:MAG: phosphoenolpyruvate carboxylase [Thalassobaculaceae bacterium]|nr:phosphoenolpyruvate carboxylase [Thalassobaculaceae bacterium]
MSQAEISTEDRTGPAGANAETLRPADHDLAAWCLDRLNHHDAIAQHDPLATGVRSLAIDLLEHLGDGTLDLASLHSVVRQISDHALIERAGRLRAQCPPADWLATVNAALAPLEEAGVAEIRSAVETTRAGIVFTAHPTFALSRRMRAILAGIASGEADAASRLGDVPHAPDPSITLAAEHEDVRAALLNAQDALRKLNGAILDWLETHVPNKWWAIRPAPLQLATWVGYDLDGRTDIHWAETLRFRLEEKAIQLARYRDTLAGIGGDDLRPLIERLSAVEIETAAQADLFAGDLEDPDVVVPAANRLTAEGPGRLTSLTPILDTLSGIIADETDTARRKALCVLAAEMQACGLGIAKIHLRVNAAQVRSAVQADLSLSGLAEFHDRRALAAAAEKAAETKAANVNFGAVFQESMTARRQMMLCAQILKHIDADAPIRFLIAEVEAPATIMGAVYLARHYGIADKVDISPLFESPPVIERGARFMERLLDEEEYVAYIRGRGRTSLQFGFSDSGRFMGQIGADLAIERLQIQVARAMAARGLEDVEVLLFNTHGESMGRGGFPGTMTERFDHLFTPWARSRYADQGLRAHAEMSFQGGDGYLYFATPTLAEATACGIARWAFAPPGISTPEDDAFYADINFSWDVYRAVKSWQEALFDDPHYQDVLGAFPPNLLPSTGSRKTRRQSGTSKGTGARGMRAIPHNAALQQLAAPANVMGGLGLAARREPERFLAHIEGSPRFSQLMQMVMRARRLTSMAVLRSYADLYSPSFWTIQASRTDRDDAAKVAYRIADRLHGRDHDHAIQRLANLLSRDRRQLDAVCGDVATEGIGDRSFPRELYVLHAIRLVLIMQAFSLTASTPLFSHRHDLTHEVLVDMALDLRFAEVADTIETIFPTGHEAAAAFSSLTEASDIAAEQAGYPEVKRGIAEPLRWIDGAIKEISVGIAHFYGAYG